MTTPASGAADGDGGLSIRPAERADLLAIVRIENESFSQPWPYDAFERFLGDDGFLVAVEGGTIAGYIVADVGTQFGRELGHVKDIAVHPDHRDSGIGTALLTRGMAVLTARGADSVKLEVRRTNDGAKRLYRQFGFEPLRRVPGYYGNGEDAIIMLRKLE
ncbi:ribosomal protein S18-alanine N-acetyltransferase [Haloterrigena sp. SYSU A558-1]|uniref:Ribosomal protein S18-alanine N-acetyltransferase n=1 Tax=Haloterrigena gelatinilytica TaxID=2741724 RepID=A0A8J8KEC7_9EURY|nr:ribosomal protein S18-alanine N-acetyltransferase [Haloterrigena gelatinilytica]NUB89892.1 ribosomal protein S18-alanine N-acetyltransferase [Haloterrigena gelatinilytica]NUC74282.1 ribosomal protein S18-alanine N-acetyltransferase [Haloterrigena gelatinilytica]